ncbi:hypothetical protein C8R44DRAFT_981503 [Mycena epipterygia]|nr:hypothetical protein C8R44DRAFT_981503 [Mycena epipterygia]
MVYNLKALTLAALALAITPVLGQLNPFCFTNAGGTVGSCESFITTFCTSIAGQLIAPNDATARCFATSTPNLKCDFTAINTGTVADNIDVDFCENLLRTVAAQCPEGGFGTPTGQAFHFAGDPNTGVCEPVCGGN